MSDTENQDEGDKEKTVVADIDPPEETAIEQCQAEEEGKALDFYQKLRKKIRKQLEKKGDSPDKRGPAYDRLVQALVLLPDLFHLAVKCLFDKRVPIANKGALVAGVTYVVSPIDIVPDFIFIAGWLDDLIVLTMGMNKFLEVENADIRAAVEEHWAGDQDLFESVKYVLEVGEAAIDFLPKKFIEMVRAMFK